jgi:hypothetical protein
MSRAGIAALACCFALGAQTAPVRPIGAVVSIDAASKRITLKTDAGPEMKIAFEGATRFLRVAPGSQDLAGAAPVALSDVSQGDRILARGRAEGDAFLASTIIVMSRADLARKQDAERADWERRGVGGVITALDPGSRGVTIRTGKAESSKSAVLQLPPEAKLRRYSPDSVRFSDARACRFEDLRIGDQVKARGAAGKDGAAFVAEELVSGAFRDFAATVAAVDAARGTIDVVDLSSKARVETRVLPASLLRRLTPAAAQAVTSSGGRDLQSMIESLPPLTLAELRPGDAVVVSGTTGDDPRRLTAIAVLTGVEPLLKPSARGAPAPGIASWNLDLNMGVGGP